MLIRDEIKAHLTAGRLIPVKSHASWSAEPRAFLLEGDRAKQIAEGRNGQDMRDRWAKLEADMAHFVEGGYVNWGLMKLARSKEAGSLGAKERPTEAINESLWSVCRAKCIHRDQPGIAAKSKGKMVNPILGRNF